MGGCSFHEFYALPSLVEIILSSYEFEIFGLEKASPGVEEDY